MASFGASALVFACGDASTDNAVKARLEQAGFVTTIGPEWYNFDSTTLTLGGYNLIYFQPNYNWSHIMAPAEEQAILDYVDNGGGLITCEWFTWLVAQGQFKTLQAALPNVPSGSYLNYANVQFERNENDPDFTTGLPLTFSVPVDSAGGTFTTPDKLTLGSRAIYMLEDMYLGLAVTTYGAGKVASFCTVNTFSQIADGNFGLLLGNTAKWAATPDTNAGCKGTVHLGDYDGAASPVSHCRFEFRDNADDHVVYGGSMKLTSGGAFNISGPKVAGTYKLVLKASHWLAKSSTVTTSASRPNIGTVNLINGDCDDDNTVTVFDYSILSYAFDSAKGDTYWDARADLDGDEVVTVFDYSILSNNFDLSGD